MGSVNVGATVTASVNVVFQNEYWGGTVYSGPWVTPPSDFSYAGGTCNAGYFAAGSSCIINVTFAPKVSGTRLGAVGVYDRSRNVAATVFIFATGNGPQLAFTPGTSSTIGTSTSFGLSGNGVAIDPSSGIWIADNANSRVLREIPNGDHYDESTIVNLSSSPQGIAIDGAGNFFFSFASGPVVELYTTGGLYGAQLAQRTIGSGFGAYAIAVDAAGNLYVADNANRRIVKETLNVDHYDESTLFNLDNPPQGIAVDGNGNLYISFASGPLWKETLNNRSYVQSTIGDGSYGAYGIAVDGNGNVYIADKADNRVLRETLAGGQYVESTILNLDTPPQGIAVDGTGKLYISFWSGPLRVVDQTVAAPQTFATTVVGTTSHDSPQPVVVANIGNAPLTFPVPSVGINPTITGYFTLDSSVPSACPIVTAGLATAGALPSGQSCNLPVSFAPIAPGVQTGSLTLTDNNLNAAGPAYASQKVTLIGTGTTKQLAPTVTVVPGSSSISVVQPLSVAVSVRGTAGNPTPSGTVTLSGSGYTSPAQSLSNGNVTFTVPANVLSVGIDTLTASYSGDATYPSATGTATVNVTALTPTVTVTPSSSNISSGQSLSIAARVTGAGSMPTGTVTLTGGGYTSPATTLTSGSATINIPANSLSAGTDTLIVVYSGDAIYVPASGAANVTVSAPPVTQPTFSLTATTPGNVNRGNSANSTITVNSTTNYSGTVALTCALNSGGPTNDAGDAPTCNAQTASVSAGGTGRVTVITTAATTAALERPLLPGRNRGLLGGAVLALLVMFGIPARRRSWRAMVGALMLVVALSSLAACGGGGGGSKGGSGGGFTDPGTRSGTYTFTVTGAGNPVVNPAPTTTFTVTVN
jgi:sugar lactone lactonase YvrE